MSTVEARITGQTTTWERDLGGQPAVHLSERIVHIEGSQVVQHVVNGVHDVAGVVEDGNGALHRTTIYIRGHHEYIGLPVQGLTGDETKIVRTSIKPGVRFQVMPRA